MKKVLNLVCLSFLLTCFFAVGLRAQTTETPAKDRLRRARSRVRNPPRRHQRGQSASGASFGEALVQRLMVAATQGEFPEEQAPWLAADQGWAKLRQLGNPDRGRELIRYHGCGGCHHIPGITGARGMSGPPLTDWAQRHFIAGKLVNTPKHLVPWIMKPQEFEPGTLMPNLGVSKQEAQDISSYLYTIGEQASTPGSNR